MFPTYDRNLLSLPMTSSEFATTRRSLGLDVGAGEARLRTWQVRRPVEVILGNTQRSTLCERSRGGSASLTGPGWVPGSWNDGAGVSSVYWLGSVIFWQFDQSEWHCP